MTFADSMFEQIYKEQYLKVYLFLNRISGSSEIAEKLARETFYEGCLKFKGYDSSCEVYTWLCCIAKDCFIKYLYKNVDKTFPIDLYVVDLAASITEEPGYRLVKNVKGKKLCDTFEEMPKLYGDVLVLRIWGEISFEEIAKTCGVSVRTAKTVFFRAKNHIKENLFNEKL